MTYDQQRSSLLQEVRDHEIDDFDALAVKLFKFQAKYNAVYRQFLKLVGLDPQGVHAIDQIPFLPIEVFKYRTVQTGSWQPETCFYSSGTTSNALRSKHLVRSLSHYHDLAKSTFQRHFHHLDQVVFLALLPHYLEAGDSSLVSMVKAFMDHAAHPLNGFFLHNFRDLAASIDRCNRDSTPFYVFGVSYALLDFVTAYKIPLAPHGHVIETGGMKGRVQEMLKSELHSRLSEAFTSNHIFSEYGMTELLSQGYSKDGEWYRPGNLMKVVVKEINDPMCKAVIGKSGALHVIDLANIDTCAFIATADLGILRSDGRFAIAGRMNDSDLRGCQLLYLK